MNTYVFETETLLGEKISALSQNCGKMLYQKKSNGVYVVIYMTYKGEIAKTFNTDSLSDKSAFNVFDSIPLPMNDFDNALENMEFLTFGELYKYTVEEIKNDKLYMYKVQEGYKQYNKRIYNISTNATGNEETDELTLYYGACDKYICMAKGSLSEMVDAYIEGI